MITNPSLLIVLVSVSEVCQSQIPFTDEVINTGLVRFGLT